jgi:hypothetical protein
MAFATEFMMETPMLMKSRSGKKNVRYLDVILLENAIKDADTNK